jgi:hypothetical protein
MLLQVDAGGPHVADDLVRRFLEREIEAALAALAYALANQALKVDLPVPARPESRMLEPR